MSSAGDIEWRFRSGDQFMLELPRVWDHGPTYACMVLHPRRKMLFALSLEGQFARCELNV